MFMRFRLIAMLLAMLSPMSLPASEPELAVHMISGAKEYESEASLKILQAHLEKQLPNVSITASWVQDGAKDLPGREHIAKADLLIVFARRMKLPEEQMVTLRDHWNRGKPVVGIRTSSHAFGNEDNAVFDREVMGGNYKGHFGGDPVEVAVASDSAAKHAVLEEVGKIVSNKMYKVGQLAKDTELLQNGTIRSKNETHPVTWVHCYKGGRMFYTSLGVPDDFRNPQFLRLLLNAVRWTTESTE